MSPQDWLQAILGGGAGIGTVAWGLVRYLNGRIDSEGQERGKAVADVNSRLQAHELHVAREYVNHDRLAATMRPLEDGIARVEGTLGRLFDELKSKQDKAHP
jgi:hypothetical protein